MRAFSGVEKKGNKKRQKVCRIYVNLHGVNSLAAWQPTDVTMQRKAYSIFECKASTTSNLLRKQCSAARAILNTNERFNTHHRYRTSNTDGRHIRIVAQTLSRQYQDQFEEKDCAWNWKLWTEAEKVTVCRKAVFVYWSVLGNWSSLCALVYFG